MNEKNEDDGGWNRFKYFSILSELSFSPSGIRVMMMVTTMMWIEDDDDDVDERRKKNFPSSRYNLQLNLFFILSY